MRTLTALLDSYFMGIGKLPRFSLILVFLSAMALIAFRLRMLGKSGIVAASVLGFVVFASLGVSGITMFLFFFLSASIVSRLTERADRVGKKSGPRDAAQVVANGLPAALSAIAYFAGAGYPALAAFAAAVAEAESDTFAGSVGILSKRDPVSIISFTKVPRGISGGVTLLGTMASAFGSAIIAVLFMGTFGSSFKDMMIITISGISGSLLDSFLGATIQVQYRGEDGELTEKQTDGAERVRGMSWMDNDAVNLISGFFSIMVASLLIAI